VEKEWPLGTVTEAKVGEFLTVEDVARMHGCSKRTVHEHTRRGTIPHRVLPHGRRCLFDANELRLWADGAELVRVDLPHGGRVVRVKR
jgi:excisionase family DNA binding protein